MKRGGDSFFFGGKTLGYGKFFGFLSSFLRFFGKKKWTQTHVFNQRQNKKLNKKSRSIFRKHVVVSCHFIFLCNNKYTGCRPSILSAKDCPVDIPRRHLDVSWTTPRRIQSRFPPDFVASSGTAETESPSLVEDTNSRWFSNSAMDFRPKWKAISCAMLMGMICNLGDVVKFLGCGNSAGDLFGMVK